MSVWHADSSPSSTFASGGGRRQDALPVLVEMLSRLTDPRKPRGVRHALGCMLAIVVVAVLAGARNFRQIGSQSADLPQPLLARLGSRFDLLKRLFSAPSEAALRRLIQKVDAAALDLLLGSWLLEWARRDDDGDLVIAVDGKVLRGAWIPAGRSPCSRRWSMTTAQIRIPDKANETTPVAACSTPSTR